jgi:ribosomal protein S18 acetylase RimI-like enzyme
MSFELDKIMIDEILFHMENQDKKFVFDVRKNHIMDIREIEEIDSVDHDFDFHDNIDRFIPLPKWTPNDGFRLMEKFNSRLKNPVVREELSAALNAKKGVFRSFKNVLEQYPETEKLWFSFKEQKMKKEIFIWYNSLREEWGLEHVGVEPDDDSFLVLEDFNIREGKDSDKENAEVLHKFCIEKRSDNISSDLETVSPFIFPGDLCLIAESAGGDFAGYICAEKKSSVLQIQNLEIKSEYRGMGLGKIMLSKFVEKAGKQKIVIDLPAGINYFSRTLHLENFKPFIQRFVKI